jgi:glutamate N-acetyltransferase / amino-acid N-acetyltransferase
MKVKKMRLPQGFTASGVRAGIRKARADLALLHAPDGAAAAAIFTTNKFQAAPVVLSAAALGKSRGRVRAVVVNSGCANAITGKPGADAARSVRARAAELLACPEPEVFLASTGVIGVVLPADKIRRALPHAVAGLSPLGAGAAAEAILTTDQGPKLAEATFPWRGKRARVFGIAKGAGMIHPRMATMLAFLMTDAPATPAYLKKALRSAADTSFNAISVDGDTSTNDTVLLMASGKLGGAPMDLGSPRAEFERALQTVCRALAWKIVRDGEGASRVLEIDVRGARTAREARLVAHAVGTSPLVKTAIYGGDPNWGRVLAAVGRSGARFSAARVSLRFGALTVVERGSPAKYRQRDAARIFARDRIPVQIDLGSGKAAATLLASDLGHDYVSCNADYRS